MKKSKKMLAGIFGLSTATAIAVTSFAAPDLYGRTLVEHHEYYQDGLRIVDDVYVEYGDLPSAEIDESIMPECPIDYELQPLPVKEVEAPDISEMTLVDHNEYTLDGLYIVDDVYVYEDEASAEPAAVGDDVWVEMTLTATRSIYGDPDKNYGTLYATMELTAKFEWNGETARVVDNPIFCTTPTPEGEKLKIEDIDKIVAGDQGSNALLGNKYAYTKYRINISNCPTSSGVRSVDFVLRIEVNRFGQRTISNS